MGLKCWDCADSKKEFHREKGQLSYEAKPRQFFSINSLKDVTASLLYKPHAA